MNENAPICDYCGQSAVYRATSDVLYNGKDYGPVWVCWPCDAWVGCHTGTTRPLGRLANAELRRWKRTVHFVFDPIWKKRWERKRVADAQYSKHMARNGRYRRLAELLAIPRNLCHIGMFDVEMCKRAIDVIRTGALEEE